MSSSTEQTLESKFNEFTAIVDKQLTTILDRLFRLETLVENMQKSGIIDAKLAETKKEIISDIDNTSKLIVDKYESKLEAVITPPITEKKVSESKLEVVAVSSAPEKKIPESKLEVVITPSTIEKKIPESKLEKFSLTPDIFTKCGIDVQPFVNIGYISELRKIMSLYFNTSLSDFIDMFVFTPTLDNAWKCQVELNHITIGSAKNFNKRSAEEFAAKSAIETLKKDPRYFKFFLITVPESKQLTPISSLINFFTSQSKFKDDKLEFIYSKVETITCCTVKFRNVKLGYGVAESKKISRELASKDALLNLKEAMNSVTIDFITNHHNALMLMA